MEDGLHKRVCFLQAVGNPRDVVAGGGKVSGVLEAPTAILEVGLTMFFNLLG